MLDLSQERYTESMIDRPPFSHCFDTDSDGDMHPGIIALAY